MTCALMNCLKPTPGMALICDGHRAARVKECAEHRGKPNYKPFNLNCVHPWHANAHEYGQLAPGRSDHVIQHRACDQCHYCGEKHPMAAA